MSVNVSPELEQIIAQLLARGGYRNEDELLGEALQLLCKRDELRADIRAGIDSLDRGEGIPAEEVFREMDEYIAR